jgi:hypothetical protein
MGIRYEQDQYWADTAMKKLPPLLDSSDMLVTPNPKNGHVTPDIRG